MNIENKCNININEIFEIFEKLMLFFIKEKLLILG